MEPILFGIIGSGWRAEFYLRIARAMPDVFSITGCTSRDETKRDSLEAQWGVKAFASADELLTETQSAFVVSSVPWAANPEMIAACVEADVPVLSETPPAPDLGGLIFLNELAAQGARIQVAEQYHLQPHHAARLALVNSGKLGTVSQAQVSAAHGYHGISLMRRLLGIMFEPGIITARTFKAPIVAGSNRQGPPSEETVTDSVHELAWFDFKGKLGVFDFTGDQYFSWIRNERVLVRGERGEIINKRVTYLKDFLTPISLDFIRHEAGPGGNLEGNYLKGIQLGEEWLYTNPCKPAALPDDEIAIAACLLKMAKYAEGGEDFYSLAEASQDHYLSLKMQEAIDTGKEVVTETMPWGA
ncbi:Gfo/Idh/MocA family protein [Planctomycetota bacterium]